MLEIADESYLVRFVQSGKKPDFEIGVRREISLTPSESCWGIEFESGDKRFVYLPEGQNVYQQVGPTMRTTGEIVVTSIERLEPDATYTTWVDLDGFTM